MSWCSRIACPATDPRPVTIFITPAGNISFKIRPSSNNESEVSVAGLITTVSPAAMAGANFQAAINNGKFHGIICPTTPMGSRITRLRVFSSKTALSSV